MNYWFHHIDPFLLRFGEGDIGIRWYGLSYVAGFLAGYLLLLWQARHRLVPLKPDQCSDLITWIVGGVLIGGRLGNFILYEPAALLANPLVLFKLWEGGMASHGGIAGCLIATWLYTRRNKLPFLPVGDALVCVAPIGIFFGRCANFINGELYGRPANVPWAILFPREIIDSGSRALQSQAVSITQSIDPALLALRAGDPLGSLLAATLHNEPLRQALAPILTPRHPSQIYEALLEGLILFLILWPMQTRLRLAPGVVSASFYLLYPVARIIGEIYREPEAAAVGPLTYGQFLSLFIALVGALLLRQALKSKNRPLTA